MRMKEALLVGKKDRFRNLTELKLGKTKERDAADSSKEIVTKFHSYRAKISSSQHILVTFSDQVRASIPPPVPLTVSLI